VAYGTPARRLVSSSIASRAGPARYLGGDLVHLGQHGSAGFGGVDGTVVSHADQTRRVQAVEIAANIIGVPIAVDRGETGRGDVSGQRRGPQLPEHAHRAG